MQLVLLADELGEKYGQQHRYYNLHTPADAIKLLCINHPELKQELIQAHHNGIGYKVIQGGAAMGYDELQLPFGSRPLLVVPVITGAGGGSTSQILLGVGLVAASFLLPGAGLFGTTSIFGTLAAGSTAAVPFAGAIGVAGGAFGTALGTAFSAVGASLILGGTANLISPQPELRNPSFGRIKGEGTNVRGPGPDGVTRGASGQQSYAFTGPANTVGSGATLPVIYGRVLTGSHLLAANIEVADESDPLKITIQKPGLGTVKINGEKLKKQLKDCGGIESKRGSKEELSIKTTNTGSKVKADKQFGPDASDDKPLQAGEIISVTDDDGERLKYYAADNEKRESLRERLDVIFVLNNGLFDYVAGEGTTKIDGFITYEIRLIVSRSSPDIEVASAQITLQGLLNQKDQELIFGNRLEMPRVPKGERVTLEVEIIDAEVYDGTTFKVQGYGYDQL